MSGIILGMGSANERRRYYVTPSLICGVHTQIDPCIWILHTQSTAVTELELSNSNSN